MFIPFKMSYINFSEIPNCANKVFVFHKILFKYNDTRYKNCKSATKLIYGFQKIVKQLVLTIYGSYVFICWYSNNNVQIRKNKI